MEHQSIPQEFKRFFWDTKFSDLHLEQHKMFIIERLLEEGNSNAIRWLLNVFPSHDLEHVVCTSRRIRAKTASFWKNRLSIHKPILCMQKHSFPKPAALWKR